MYNQPIAEFNNAPWSELSDAAKIERLREVIKGLQQELSSLSSRVYAPPSDKTWF